MLIDIHSAKYRSNPYPTLKYLRNKKNICRIESSGYWLVANYLDVQMILENPTLFSSSGIVQEPCGYHPEFFLHSRGLVGCDPPDHTRLRRLLSKAFTPLSIRKLAPKIRMICEELIKAMSKHNTVNIVDAFSVPLPILVMAEIMGIEKEKTVEFKQWADLLLTWQKLGKTPEVLIAAKQMFDYFNEVIETRKKNNKEDLISNLLLTAENDQVITHAEILAMIRLLLVAGTDTTTNLITNGVLALSAHSDQMERIKAHPKLINQFIEETLRYNSPVLSLMRKTNLDIEIGEVKFKKNDIVLPLLASANHDETIFNHPEKFDITRDARPHLTFGAGIHYCLGSQLARLQVSIAFQELLKNFHKFEINTSRNHEYLNSFFFRSLKNVWLNVAGNLKN